MKEESIEQQIRKLADLEEIRKLKHRYVECCDNDYDPDGIAELFVEDAIWDGGEFGHAEGREAIHEMFVNMKSRVSYALHSLSNEIIEVDGDRATGRWCLFQPLVVAGSDQAMWLIAKYNDVYVRRDGKWFFQTLKITGEVFSPYELGFGKMRFAEVPA